MATDISLEDNEISYILALLEQKIYEYEKEIAEGNNTIHTIAEWNPKAMTRVIAVNPEEVINLRKLSDKICLQRSIEK